jgi:hypothetical protein
MTASAQSASTREVERRRDVRLLRDIALVVRGKSIEQRFFQEDTFTISISRRGVLMLMANLVQPEQILVLNNPATNATVECRVARLGPPYGGLAQVGVEFLTPAPDFWQPGILD